MSTQLGAPANPGARYRDIFEGTSAVIGSGRSLKGGLADRTRDRLVREEWQRVGRRGWDVVELLNYHPWPLRVDLGELGIVAVPSASDGGPGRCLIDIPRISMRDLGDGNFVPLSVLPCELAQEVEREYRHCGGVVWTVAGQAATSQQVEEARNRQLAWYRQEFRRADNAWARYHQHQFITERQRDAAKALAFAGEIDQLPEWVSQLKPAGDRLACPACGEEIKVTARICRYCRTRVNDRGEPRRNRMMASDAAERRPRRPHDSMPRASEVGPDQPVTE